MAKAINQPSNIENPGKLLGTILYYFKKLPELSVGRRNSCYQPKEEMRSSLSPAWEGKGDSIWTGPQCAPGWELIENWPWQREIPLASPRKALGSLAGYLCSNKASRYPSTESPSEGAPLPLSPHQHQTDGQSPNAPKQSWALSNPQKYLESRSKI